MCGIFGAIRVGKTVGSNDKVVSYLKDAAMVGHVRGEDSFGFISLDKDKSLQVRDRVDIFKAAVPGYAAIHMPPVKDTIANYARLQAFIGHHRATSSGITTHRLAHPFVHADGDNYLVGVHNGTLQESEKYRGVDYEVDSNMLYSRIMNEGAIPVLEDIVGSWALVWIEQDGLIRMTRNSGRPLHFGVDSKRSTMLIASESGMVHWLADRNGIELEDIYSLRECVLYTFDPDNPLDGMKMDKYEETHSYGKTSNFWASKQSSTTSYTSPSKFIYEKAKMKEFDIEKDKPCIFYVTSVGDPSGTLSNTYYDLSGYAVFPGEDLELIDAKAFSVKEDQLGAPPTTGELLHGNVSGIKIFDSKEIEHVSIRSVRKLTPDEAQEFEKWNDGGGTYVKNTIEGGNNSSTSDDDDDNDDDSEGDRSYLPFAGNVDMYNGPHGKAITELEFYRLTKHGCGNCSKDLDLNDSINGNIIWSGDSPVCYDCMSETLDEGVA